jgi:transcriptional regulator with XRE-family HTH domain
MDLPGRITRWREDRKLSKASLSRAVGVTRAAVSHWEAGDATPSLETLAKIVDALGISMADFWGAVPRKRRAA